MGAEPLILYKSQLHLRLESEWPFLDDATRSVVVWCGGYSSMEWGRRLTLTTIYRTQAEQDLIYQNNEKYQESPWKSYHQLYLAVDFRFSPLSELQWKALEARCKTLFFHLGTKFVIHSPGGPSAPHVHLETHRNYQGVLDYVRNARG